ncbi:hypothetical protein KJ628_01790 [Patescibacteria group bacterium]|nr:hypothetical protein [Patescibacteria group bacterium]
MVKFFYRFIKLILFSIIFLLIPSPAKASELPQVMIINQVRGTECCEIGEVEIFQKQLDYFTEKQLPAFFTLRWDVLNDSKFIDVIKKANSELFNWGIFLEITPDLATAAEVNYTGTVDNWYQAQHAYTLGYLPEEREQLIDTIMAKYKEIFGHYPTLTTSWIIDTPTLNYLHDEYGVEVHQITREQWGTDSYTLYGGPPHYPYPASRNWAFIPDYAAVNPTIVVRQTLTDPVWNYGDTQSRFTSQPNDFAQDGKGFEYFEKLFNQALFEQPVGQTGFALLGLENSMKDKYQQLFKQQLQVVADYQQQGKIILPDLKTLKKTWQSTALTVYQGRDLVKNTSSQAIWISGQNYRVRIIKKEQQICVDDLRLYDAALQDYYADHQARDSSYWVTPFLIDGSRFYTHEKSWFGKEYTSNGMLPLPDMVTQPECWELPMAISAQDQLQLKQVDAETLTIDYQSEEGLTSLIFKPTSFKFPPALDNVKLAWSVNGDVVYELTKKCATNFCWYTPWVNPKIFAQAQEIQTSAFLPEQRAGKISTAQSKLYADNPYAIAGRNPVRVVFIPRDEQGVGVKLESPPNIETEVKLITDPALVLADDPQFYDFMSDEPQRAKIQFTVDSIQLTVSAHFAPNCKNNPKYCLSHPRQAWWYLRSLIGDKQRLFK